MTWREFVASTIDHMAWPVVALSMILLFRSPLRTLLESVSIKRLTATATGFSVEFEQRLHEVRDLQGSIVPDLVTVARSASGPPGYYARFCEEMGELAELSPRAVVFESHERLTRVLEHIADAKLEKYEIEAVTTFRSVLDRLAYKEAIEPRDSKAATELTMLQQQIASEPSLVIDSTSAMEYAKTAYKTAQSMRRAIGETGIDGPPI